MISFIKRARSKVGILFHLLTTISISFRRSRYEELRDKKKDILPLALGGYGYKVFSQSDEDGIIQEVFRRIGVKNKIFVEFGVGDGLENNTTALLYDDWFGLWIEGSVNFCTKIESGFSSVISTGQLKLVNSFVTPDNINELISCEISEKEIDLLSIDIDGNDAHVLENISCIRPRLIVLEYNAKFGPSIDYCMGYDESYMWNKTDCFGASLKHFELLMHKKGYSCVGCNIVGTNSFFVRNDLLEDHFLTPSTSEKHFEPARYELVGLPSGHPCSYRTFNTKFEK